MAKMGGSYSVWRLASLWVGYDMKTIKAQRREEVRLKQRSK